MNIPLVRPEDEPGRQLAAATLIVSHSLEPLRRLRRGLDLWLGGILLVGAAGSLVLAFWFSDRISRPLADLAHRSQSRGPGSSGDPFRRRSRRDEVGTLARVLNAMTDRLRAGARQLRDAERRATLGEMARQVNHDIRNGLTPMRNVLRHLGQVARDEPDRLPAIFGERGSRAGGGHGLSGGPGRQLCAALPPAPSRVPAT